MPLKCSYCRSDIKNPASTVSDKNPICERCVKNEKHYGKPSICTWCQLPAAFLGGKCVHCSHGERKYGPPHPCRNCKLKSAFQTDSSKSLQNLTCRLCKISSKKSKVKMAIKQKLKHLNDSEEGVLAKQLKTSLFESGSGMDIVGDQIVATTQLKDQVASLKAQLSQKDSAIMERDKKIGALNARILKMEKDQRTKVASLQKENSETQLQLKRKINELTRQVASLSKGKKYNSTNVNTDNNSPSSLLQS